MENEFKNKRILVTGGTGTIGSSIVRKLLNYDPKVVRVFSNDENATFELQQELGYCDNTIRYLSGDIRDKERITRAMEDIDIIFHAAALKHVPLCEYNPSEAVKTNVIGTQNLIEASINNNVGKFIGISTDKASSPSNVMGCTKLLMERLILSSFFHKGKTRTKFCSVRFGNVLGSRGSVVPLFVKQIKQNKPITVTDPDMTRFFMSIDQAVDLIFKSSDITNGQEIFILKMPVAKIGDLAHSIIDIVKEKNNLNRDIDIEIIGKRAGEKQHEKLMALEESEKALERDDMFIIRPNIEHQLFSAFSDKAYPESQPADLGSYSSKDQKILSKKEIKKMLLSIPDIDFNI